MRPPIPPRSWHLRLARSSHTLANSDNTSWPGTGPRTGVLSLRTTKNQGQHYWQYVVSILADKYSFNCFARLCHIADNMEVVHWLMYMVDTVTRRLCDIPPYTGDVHLQQSLPRNYILPWTLAHCIFCFCFALLFSCLLYFFVSICVYVLYFLCYHELVNKDLYIWCAQCPNFLSATVLSRPIRVVANSVHTADGDATKLDSVSTRRRCEVGIRGCALNKFTIDTDSDVDIRVRCCRHWRAPDVYTRLTSDLR